MSAYLGVNARPVARAMYAIGPIIADVVSFLRIVGIIRHSGLTMQ